MEHQVKVKISTTLYLVNQVAKNKNFSKTAVTFLVIDSMTMFVNSYYINLVKFVFVYISQINLSDSSATQWVFNLKSQSKPQGTKFGILM